MEPWRVFVYAISTLLNLPIILTALFIQFGKPHHIVRLFMCSMVYLVTVLTSVVVISSSLAVFLSNLISIFLIITCYAGKMRQKIITTILMYVLFILMEGIGVLASGLFEFSSIRAALIARHSIIKIIVLATLQLISRFKYIREGYPFFSIINTVIFGVVPIGSVIIVILNLSDLESRALNNLLTIGILVIMNMMIYSLFNIISHFYIELNKAQSIKQQITYYQQQINDIQSSQENARIFQHDMKNYLLNVHGYINAGNMTAASTEIMRLIDDEIVVSVFSETGNIAIDSILNYKLPAIEKHNAKVELELAVPTKMGFMDYDISLVLGNILDNVREAFQRLPDEQEKTLDCCIRITKGVLKIQVKNTFDGIYSRNGTRMATRKDNILQHGLGLWSVEQTIEKYNGDITFKIMDDLFITYIMMFENSETA